MQGLDTAMGRAEEVLDKLHHGDRWTPPARLSRADREQTDAVLGDLVERLAFVATLSDPRRTT
jgi:iron uptake system component EfeO